MTLMHRSHKRCRRDIEMSPVVVGGMMINFPPRPRSALASGGALCPVKGHGTPGLTVVGECDYEGLWWS